MSLPKYAEYKSSGVDWLKEVPSHWAVRRLNSFCKFMAGKAHEPFVADDGEFVCVTARFVSTQGNSSKRCTRNLSPARPRDILMVMSDLPNGRALARAYLVKQDGRLAVNQRVCAISVQAGFPEYFYFQLDRHPKLLSYDDSVEQTHLSNGSFQQLALLFPPVDEQSAIAAFLDRETAKIDALIAEQEKLIALLAEKRQATISHAVTRGLNPDAPMKDSGVAWLGEVPAHWDIKNVGYVLDAIGDVDHYMPESVEKGVPYLMTGDLKNSLSDVNLLACKQVSYDDYLSLSKRIKSSNGDVIMARYATIGASMYVDMDVDFLVSYSCVTLKTKYSEMSGLYLFQHMKSDGFRQGVENQVNTNTQGNVGVKDLQKVKIAVPPLDEQIDIANFLDRENSKLDTLRTEAERAIALLKERRSALIAAAVTGQIDVRGRSAN